MRGKAAADLEDMLSDHRTAVLKMSVPLLLGILVSTLQYFIDTFWCSGLGSESMAAITVAGPLYMTIANAGVGLGVGATTAIARALGAGDRRRADGLGAQAVVSAAVIAVALSSLVFLAAEPMLRFMTGDSDVSASMEYVRPYLLFSIPFLLDGVLGGMLRGEGAARKVTVIAMFACAANVTLDPLFIYGLGWGVTGASVATCLTYAMTSAVMLCWFLSGRMNVRPRFGGFRLDAGLQKDLLAVGIPQMLQMIITPLMIAPQNAIVMSAGGNDGILCTTLPFQFISLAMIPAAAMSTASISVASAALGQRDFGKAENCFRYTMKVSLAVSAALAVFLAVAADLLVNVYTGSGDMARLHDEMAMVLRIYSASTILNSILRISSAAMQTMRYAHVSTVLMFLRECLFILFYYIASFSGMYAIYWALIAVNVVSAAMLYAGARATIAARRREYVSPASHRATD